MASGFELTQHQIRSEAAIQIARSDIHVEEKLPRVVKAHDYQTLKGSSGGSALSDGLVLDAKDGESSALALKASRFRLSDLARQHLPVAEEERRAVDEQVRTRIEALSKETFEAARQEGLAEGRALGRNEAYEEFAKSAGPKLERLTQLVAGFESVQQEILAANERFFVELILRIARKVCLKELATDEGYVSRLVEAMVARTGIRENIRVRIHPSQVDLLVELRSSLLKSFGELKNLQLGISAEVEVGACEVDTDFTNLKAGIDSQLEAVRAELLDAQLGNGGEKAS